MQSRCDYVTQPAEPGIHSVQLTNDQHKNTKGDLIFLQLLFLCVIQLQTDSRLQNIF